MIQPAPADLSVPRCRAVALLVDAENTPATLAGRCLEAARGLGALAVLRAFGDAPHLGAGWRALGFQPVLTHAGKNVADMTLTVAAMELSSAGAIDGFVIASADRDFAPLVWSLRGRGFPVWGIAAAPMAASLGAVYSRHIALAAPATAEPASPYVDALRATLAGGAISLADFAKAMGARGLAKPKGRNWASVLAPHAAHVELIGSGPGTRVRLRPG